MGTILPPHLWGDYNMSDLFAKFLLGDSFQEAAPPPPPQAQPGNPNDPANMVAPPGPPPDMTGGAPPPMMDPNAGAPVAPPMPPGDPNMGPPPDPSGAGAAMPPGPPTPDGGMDPSMGAGGPPGDPNAAPPMDPNGQPMDPNAPPPPGEPNAAPPPPDGGNPAGDDSMAPPGDLNTEIDNAEKEIFSDLKPEQQLIKKTELKERYQELHKALISTLDKINKVSHTSYDDVMLDFIVKKLVNLKTMVADSLIDAFPTRSYFDNKVELQRLVRSFNYATFLLTKVYESRLKRQQVIAKMNSKKRFEKAPEAFPIFNRGYDVQ